MSKRNHDGADEDSPVGYGNPPVSTRFQKGHSGNPNGRPKGSQSLNTVIQKAAKERVEVTVRGKRRSFTVLELAAKQMTNKAAKGDLNAQRALFDRVQQAEAVTDTRAPTQPVLQEADEQVIANVLARLMIPTDSEPEAPQGETP